MNITFLVGNGFDLSLGMDTSYESFYEWYCKKQSLPGIKDSDVIQQLKENIGSRRENKNWSDLEIALGRYTSNFTIEDSEFYIECYEDIHSQMVEFIKQAEQIYYDNSESILPETFLKFGKSILDFYRELSPKEQNLFDNLIDNDRAHNTIINFITFNYTSILDTYVKGSFENKKELKEWNYNGGVHSIKINPNVLHIHGELNLYPVLGVGDEQDVTNQDLLTNPDIQDTLLKRNHIDYLMQPWYDDAEKIIDESTIICLFGMSLGQSDAPWWRKIMSWLSQSKSRHLIIFWHSSETDDNVSVIKRRRIREPIKEKLMSYCSASADKTIEINERIHIIINSEKVLIVV